MEKVVFIFKSISLSVVLGFIIGAVLGIIMDQIKAPGPNQIANTWPIFGIMSALLAVAISIVVSIIMASFNKTDLQIQSIISGIFVIIADILLIFSSILRII